MSRIFRSTGHVFNRGSRAGLLPGLAAVLLLAAGQGAHAQLAATEVHDTTILRPPEGVRVAIIEFADMECPVCATSNPLLKDATEKYHLPWLRHDFPLPYHAWSFNAAVNARWFDSQSKPLGNEYRDQVFANQSSIYSPEVLSQFTQRFAASHHIALPFAIDPQGKLAAAVKADYALGQRVGIEHTPTIWVVISGSKARPTSRLWTPSRTVPDHCPGHRRYHFRQARACPEAGSQIA